MTTNSVSDTITSDVQAEKIALILPKLQSLQIALESENPEIRGYLKAIHTDLAQYPDLAHLLTDEQIAPIYSAIRQQTNVVIEAKAAKKKSGAKATADTANLLMGLL